MIQQEELRGSVAVITGGGGGIGEGIARHAASLGMVTVLADVNADAAERVARDLRRSGAVALAVPTEVRQADSVESLASKAYSLGPVRLLVNNAGIEAVGYSWEIAAEQWKNLIDVNVNGVIHGVRAFVPRMIDAGIPAHVANVASLGALSIMPMQAGYLMSKHAVLAFTECLALEIESCDAPITVSAVLPGSVASNIMETVPDIASDAGAFHLNAMRALLAAGMPPVDAGRCILEGIMAGRFWVITHPQETAFIAKVRAEHLRDLSRPLLLEQSRPLLKSKTP